jgi:hypothetical protein
MDNYDSKDRKTNRRKQLESKFLDKGKNLDGENIKSKLNKQFKKRKTELLEEELDDEYGDYFK